MFIIFGFRSVTLGGDQGSFFCPQCGQQRYYLRKRIRRFFTLFFIPLIPLDVLAEYVECLSCRGTFRPEALNRNPVVKATEDFHQALMYVLIGMTAHALDFRAKRVEQIRQIYAELTAKELSHEEIKADIDAFNDDSGPYERSLRTLAPNLGDQSKEKLIRASLLVARSGEPLTEQQRVFLDSLAEKIRITPAHLRGIVSEFLESSDESADDATA
ncbi:MAG TPA: hypothetical protein P5081_15945 [Phycisphaerae bacterium]|nr:hypothetical protein [Phycisphaerae bacterium]HRW54364.1 hypothetical protein [Phycisphaerae bacterium]